MQCEMCGTPGPTRRALIEGTPMSVCARCIRFGKPLDPAPGSKPGMTTTVADGLARRERRMGARKDVFAAEEMALELVEDFGERIRIAREKRGWTRQQLGARVKEPENVVNQLEAGTLHPTDEAAKRIERELGIKLYERVAQVVAPKKGGPRGLTLGDMIRTAKKKDE